MASRVRIGPEGGPYAVVDERDGRLVFEVPEDEIDFDANDVTNILVVSNTETEEPGTPDTGELNRWYDSSDAAYKAKFDDGETVTIAQK